MSRSLIHTQVVMVLVVLLLIIMMTYTLTQHMNMMIHLILLMKVMVTTGTIAHTPASTMDTLVILITATGTIVILIILFHIMTTAIGTTLIHTTITTWGTTIRTIAILVIMTTGITTTSGTTTLMIVILTTGTMIRTITLTLITGTIAQMTAMDITTVITHPPLIILTIRQFYTITTTLMTLMRITVHLVSNSRKRTCTMRVTTAVTIALIAQNPITVVMSITRMNTMKKLCSTIFLSLRIRLNCLKTN